MKRPTIRYGIEVLDAQGDPSGVLFHPRDRTYVGIESVEALAATFKTSCGGRDKARAWGLVECEDYVLTQVEFV